MVFAVSGCHQQSEGSNASDSDDQKAVNDFFEFITSNTAKEVYKKGTFCTNVIKLR